MDAIHLTVIGFMIVPEQMKDSMHEQLPDLSFRTSRPMVRLPESDFRGDYDFTQEWPPVQQLVRIDETEDIGRIVAATVSPVQASHARAGDKNHQQRAIGNIQFVQHVVAKAGHGVTKDLISPLRV